MKEKNFRETQWVDVRFTGAHDASDLLGRISKADDISPADKRAFTRQIIQALDEENPELAPAQHNIRTGVRNILAQKLVREKLRGTITDIHVSAPHSRATPQDTPVARKPRQKRFSETRLHPVNLEGALTAATTLEELVDYIGHLPEPLYVVGSGTTIRLELALVRDEIYRWKTEADIPPGVTGPLRDKIIALLNG